MLTNAPRRRRRNKPVTFAIICKRGNYSGNGNLIGISEKTLKVETVSSDESSKLNVHRLRLIRKTVKNNLRQVINVLKS